MPPSLGLIVVKCANNIFKEWAYIQEEGQGLPEALQEFRPRLEKRVQATSGRTLKGLADLSTLSSLDTRRELLQEAIAIEPT